MQKIAESLLGLTKTMLSENGLVDTPGGDPDITTKKLDGKSATKRDVTGGGGSGGGMDYSLEAAEDPDNGTEFNDGPEFNDCRAK